MSSLRIAQATEEHARQLAPRMREADVVEIWASHAVRPLEALLHCVEESDIALVILDGEEPVAMFGTGPMSTEVGAIWMLTGDLIDRWPVAFLRIARKTLPILFQGREALVNAIDARNTRSLRWARWMGFEISPAISLGVAGLPFHPIHIRRERVCAS
jgi:hypothetical protein